MREPVENPPDLTEEDERLLDKAWSAVNEWKPAHAVRTSPSDITVLGWGKNQ
jgi:hypothetical protein